MNEELQILISELWLKIKGFLYSFPPLIRWVLILLLLLTIPVYWTSRITTGFLISKNLNSQLSRATRGFSEPENLIVENTRVVYPGDRTESYIEISNPNFEIAVRSAKYNISFVNASGAQIDQQKGNFFLAPSEHTYIVATGLRKETVSAQVELSDIVWVKRFTQAVPKVKFTVPLLDTTYDNNGNLVVNGQLINQSPFLVSRVRIVFLLRGEGGRVLTVSQREERDIQANSPRAFRQVWPDTLLERITKVDVYTQTDLLDTNNIRLAQ